MPLLGGACKMTGAPTPAGDPRFTGDPYTVFDYSLPPADSLAGIELDADGAIEAFTDAGNAGDIGRWDNGLGTLSKIDYQFRLDTISGFLAATSDAADVWLAASAGLNSFFVEVTGQGIRSFQGTLRVRLAASPFTEYDSATVNLTAEATP